MFKKSIRPTIKLKHLEIVGASKVNYAKAMTDIFGYKNSWISKKLRFAKTMKLAFHAVKEIQDIDISKLTLTEDCPINTPMSIDYICFGAMMELQQLLGGDLSETDLSEHISRAIAIACFEVNNESDYSSGSKDFEKFQKKILGKSLVQMMGLYNWIVSSIKESATTWSERFMSVEVLDEDYAKAGGDRMAQFNVITTLKSICQEFNVPLGKAELVSYNLVQTNSYANATSSRIQDDMRILKEAKFKAKRNNN
tara:strand:+ start:140 stop:898 length:759 start_codon:yes stop_codon:yes gene_type:complete